MKWEILNSTYPFECPWLRIRKDHVLMPSGLEIPDFYVEELPNWVNVIAITKEGLFVLEEQYRHGIQSVCVELPAGVVEKDEDPLTAAQRELKEETGYTDGEWIPYGSYAPNTSGCNNICFSFIALGVEKTTDPKKEPTEDIKLRIVTKNELKNLLISNQIKEGVMQAPLWRYFSEK